MAINLAAKYASAIAQAFTKSSFVKPNTMGNIDFVGAKTVRVYKLSTVDEVEYTRGGTNRYGAVGDVQDEIMEYTMKKDVSFTRAVDKGDESDQTISDKAGKFLAAQIKEKSVPNADKYALAQFAKFGKVVGVSAPTKMTVVPLFADAMQAMDDALVPDDNRVAYVPGTVFKLIAQSDEFVKIETLGEKSIARGEVGELFGFKIIKVPTSYLPNGCYFIACHKNAVCMPYKISETKIHKDPPGISGALVEGRYYYDAFVLGEKADAVYAAVDSTKVQATPTFGGTGVSVTITSADAAEIRYTVDGSDPRFAPQWDESKRTGYRVYGAQFDAKSGDTVRAVAFAPAGKFTSAIAAKKIS